MFLSRKKIREMEKQLENSQNNESLNELVESIMSQNPKPADSKFTNELKAKLLAKHNTMTKSKEVKKETRFNLWSDLRFRGWAVALATLVIMVLAGIIAYPIIPAPTVKGYILKGSTREMSVNAPFKITFSQLMDTASVESRFSIDPEVKGSFNWSGNTLEFKPEVRHEIGKTFKITIGKEARSLLQKPLESEYSEFYKIIAPPKVLLMTPNDASTGIPEQTQINIMFDRPLTGLTTLDAGRGDFPAIKIEPATAGKYKWLGTSTLQFIPEKLNLATTYKVTVPKETKVLDGGFTEEEFSSTFETARPDALSVYATDTQNSYNFSPNSKFVLEFNQKVDLGSAQQMIKLSRMEGAESKEEGIRVRYYNVNDWHQEQNRTLELTEMNQIEPIELAKDQPLVEEPKIEIPKTTDLEKKLVIEPTQAMMAGTAYTLNVRAGLKGFEGPLTTTADKPFAVYTSGEFKLLSSNNDYQDSGVGAMPIFAYSNRLDLRSLRGKIKISPAMKDENGKDLPPNVSSYTEASILISYDYQPTTDYVINIDGGVKDILGNLYNQPTELKFKTGSYQPGFSLEKGTDISVLDGYQASKFYIKSVNIDHADLKLKKLSEEQFRSVYGSGYMDYRNISSANFGGDFDFSGKQNIDFVPNRGGHTLLDLDRLSGQKLAPGFYYMEISNPTVKVSECTYYWETSNPGCTETVKIEKNIFVVSKSSLAIKYNVDEMLVWATDLTSGKPVQGMKITLVSNGLPETASGETDISGLAKIKLPAVKDQNYYRDYMVYGSKDSDMAFVHTTWSEGVSAWNFNLSSEPISAEYYLYQYTDRPIYRPDQEVYFKGILRQEKDYKFRLPDVKKVNVTISDAQGNQIYQKEHDLNSNGTYSGMIKLGSNITSGDYSMSVTLVDAKGPEWLKSFYTSFKVYEYRKPEYKLDLTTDKTSYVNGETAKVKVVAGYFFGAPLKNAETRWTLKAQGYYFILPDELSAKLTGSWFSFADEGYFCYWGCTGENSVVGQGTVKTDENGLAEIVLPLNINDKKISQIYTLEVAVSDANNQGVANRISVPVHKGDFYLGIRSQEYVINPNTAAKFDVVTVTTDGKELPARNVDVSLYERTWNTVKRKSVDGDYYFENTYDDKLIEKKSVKTGDNGMGTVEFNIKKGGVYKVEATGKDGRGNLVSSSTSVYVSGDEFINWGSENNDKIELVADKMEYKVGDTAKILVKSPYKDVYALVTYERDKVLDQKVIKLSSNSDSIEVPITEKFLPNIFVSVVLVKGNSYDAGLMEPLAGAPDERQIAAFKIGYTTLQVNTETKRLNVEIKSDKERYAPGENVKLTLKTTDFAAKGIPAELSVAVVDESVLSLTESVTADLLNVFYRKRLLGVNFAHTLTKAISRINVQVESGMKGGGGGEAAKRGTFKDTAHFQATVKTDADGVGTVEFKLPDNLTTWQVLAIGVSDDSKVEKTLVGSGKYSFLATKDILARPVLPRFMTSGDQMTISVIIHNYTNSNQNLKVSLEASGVEIQDGAERNLTLASGGDQKVNWKIKVGAVGQAKFTFTAIANGGERGDSVEVTLKVKESSFPEVVATSQVISGENKEIEKVWLPTGLDITQGGLEIRSAATLAGSINKGLEYLITYPYGCTEQLASAILPNVAVKRLINLGKFDTTGLSVADVDKNVQKGLSELYKNQQANGDIGLWMNSTGSAYLTAYVVSTMHEAEMSGYAIDKDVYSRAVEYLKNYMYQKDQFNEDPVYRANNFAYALYVLSEVGQGDLAMMNKRYDERSNLRLISKAYLAMGYQNLKLDGDSAKPVQDKIETLRKELENAAQQTPRGVNFAEKDLDYRLFDTNTRTTAVVLKALNRINSENPLIPKILQSLLRERKAGHFSTTQETAVSLLAMLEYLEKSKELSPAYEALVAVNGENIIDENFTSKNLFEIKEKTIALKDLLQNNLDNEISAEKIGQGKLYLDMNLKYYLPTAQQKAENQGIEVLQEYFAQDDAKMEKPLNEVKVGQNIHGRMTVIVPEDRYYVMIEDYLPAGLEGIDFNLKTSEQSLQEQNSECFYDCYYGWYFNHSEVKDDRIMYFADFLPKGVYEIDYYLRSTSVGQFADLPTIAQETYFPEVFGRTEGKQFTVTE